MLLKILYMRFVFLFCLLFVSSTILAQNQQSSPAGLLMQIAAVQAKAENKKIFVIFHASWCGWCKKMDASMSDPLCKKYFDDNFIIVHLTVQESAANKHFENPGADSVMKKYHAEKAGLPFWIILTKDQTLLADSYIRTKGEAKDEAGENIGCPAKEDEVNAFIQILKNTASLKENELLVIAKRFRQNESH